MLLDAGLSRAAVDAAWPGWWQGEAEDSASARAELRFALARRLGLSPRSLVGDRVEFVWRDEARFKRLTAADAAELAAITSFGISAGRLLLRATRPVAQPPEITAASLRDALLKVGPWADLSGLLSVAWGLGIPVIHLRVFPLAAKSMTAMVVEDCGRHAILLAHDARYPAPVAFWLAHELGHIFLEHLAGSAALIDFEDKEGPSADPQEIEADRFALELLTGEPNPQIVPGARHFTGRELARAAMAAGSLHGIEPGTLALVLGHQLGTWAEANVALDHIYDTPRDVWAEINGLAQSELFWSGLSDDDTEYLEALMGVSHG